MKSVLFFLMLSSTLAFCQNSSEEFVLTVASSLKITTPKFLPRGTVGGSYSTAFVATGGVAPYTWEVALSTGQTGLPSGLSLSSGGVLSGTISSTACSIIAACRYSFTVTVTDSSGTVGKITITSDMKKDS